MANTVALGVYQLNHYSDGGRAGKIKILENKGDGKYIVVINFGNEWQNNKTEAIIGIPYGEVLGVRIPGTSEGFDFTIGDITQGGGGRRYTSTKRRVHLNGSRRTNIVYTSLGKEFVKVGGEFTSLKGNYKLWVRNI